MAAGCVTGRRQNITSDDDQKGVGTIDTLGGPQQMLKRSLCKTPK
jgi:hypothetical protein